MLGTVVGQERQRREHEVAELVVHGAEDARACLFFLRAGVELLRQRSAFFAAGNRDVHHETRAVEQAPVTGRRKLPRVEHHLFLQLDREIER